MILFALKTNGDIVGTIEGHVHTADQLKMTGDETKVFMLIVAWIPFRYYDKERNIIPADCIDALYENGEPVVISADYEPDHEQKELFINLDKRPSDVYKYRIDEKTNRLVFKS